MDEFTSTLQRLWPFVLVAAPGLFAAWQAWRTARRDDRKDKLDLFKDVQGAAGTVIETLRAEVDRLRDRLEEMDAEFSKFRKDHDTMIEAKEAKIALLEQKLDLKDGACRHWQAQAEAYERLLEANGIPHAKPVAPVWEVAGGSVRAPMAVDPESVGAGR